MFFLQPRRFRFTVVLWWFVLSGPLPLRADSSDNQLCPSVEAGLGLSRSATTSAHPSRSETLKKLIHDLSEAEPARQIELLKKSDFGFELPPTFVPFNFDGARQRIQNGEVKLPEHVRLAKPEDAKALAELAAKLELKNKGSTDKGFLVNEFSETEAREIINEGLIMVYEDEHGIQAFLAEFPSGSAYDRSHGSWSSHATAFGNLQPLLENPTANTRLAAAKPDAPARAILKVEAGLEKVAGTGQVSLGKILLTPLNKQSLEIHLALGHRIVGYYYSSDGKLWAVIGKAKN
jgi:hypothetical protein